MHSNFQVEVLLVITEGDIKTRVVFLDQVILEQQSFDLRVGKDHIKVSDSTNK